MSPSGRTCSRRRRRRSYSTTRLFLGPEDADATLLQFAACYNYHRLHGELDWQTPAECWDGTPFTDRGFEYVPIEHPPGLYGRLIGTWHPAAPDLLTDWSGPAI